MIWLKSKHELEMMRRAGRLTEQTLEAIREIIRPGIKTQEIDAYAENFIRKNGGLPSFKGYRGFPKSICTSINSVVVHGIPDNTRLCEGDIISIDVGVYLGGFNGDAARTFPVGKISSEAERLINVMERCFFEAMAYAVPGNRIGDISAAVQKLAEDSGYGVVRSLVGHGIGREMHEAPDVPNFGRPGRGTLLREGMTIAVEPMINEGTYEVFVAEDGWTVLTADGKLSAHYENTVAITENGPELLTLSG